MTKKFKVVMLPTEKVTGICKDKRDSAYPKLLNYHTPTYQNDLATRDGHAKNYNLYILSDDEIKEGDWFYDKERNKISLKPKYYTQDLDYTVISKYPCKKIVATTDKSLNGKSDSGLQMCLCGTWQMDKDGYPACKGNCHTLDIPKSFIQSFIKAYNDGKPITEVELEMIKCYGRCIEGLDDCQGDVIKTRPDNTVIIHQSKMYTIDEVLNIINEYKNRLKARRIIRVTEGNYSKVDTKESDKWIEDNL